MSTPIGAIRYRNDELSKVSQGALTLHSLANSDLRMADKG